MKRNVQGLLVFVTLGLAGGSGLGQGPGGGDLNSRLVLPGSDPAPASPPFIPAAPPSAPEGGSVKNLWPAMNPGPAGSGMLEQKNQILAKLRPREGPDPNQDILAHSNLGPWMICVISYTGNDAASMARTMVQELRGTYKLPAYVFNYGLEEKRREYERVKAEIERQIAVFRQHNVSVDQPLRVPHQRIEEQVAVLVGGYPNEDVAKRSLDHLRKLQGPDPKKVALQTKYFVQTDKNIDLPTNQFIPDASKIQKAEVVYVNPFQRAFLVRNPTSKAERPAEWDQMDISVLKRLNSEEEFSLLKNKKAVTLVLKMFRTPTVVQQKSATGAFLENIGLGTKSERVDAAAVSAHNLAEFLRKAKLEAYVLHSKYFSLVTVGGYDSLDDPNLRSMQNLLAARLVRELEWADLFPTPVPMNIPR